jgi:hypothetical protein
MAIVTPAHIKYTPEGDGAKEQILNFDAVIAEDHAAKAKVTKYPVQSGYHVSNHSIRENRIVSLTGLITNVKLFISNEQPTNEDGSENTNYGSNTNYGTDPSRQVKEILESLIHSGFECEVVTNLAVYTPVVFTSFKTQQKAGMVDSMQFTLVGEEIIKVEADFTAPKPVVFTEVTGTAREVLVEELAAVEIYAGPCDKLSNGSFVDGEDFIITDVDSAGKSTTTTYVFLGRDPTTGVSNYEVHVNTEAVEVVDNSESEAENDPCAEDSFVDSLLGGIKQIACCLLDDVTDIALDIVEDTIETAMGDLKRSARGVLYDAVSWAGGPDSVGGMILNAGVACVARGVTQSGNEGTYLPGESLPSAGEIMTGAGAAFGLNDPAPSIMSLTKIECDCVADQPNPLTGDLPLPSIG